MILALILSGLLNYQTTQKLETKTEVPSDNTISNYILPVRSNVLAYNFTLGDSLQTRAANILAD